MIPNLKIDPQRLWDTLMDTAQIGGTPKGGIRRLTLTDEDKRVRNWFRQQCEALGCTVTVDEVGTMFARREGKDPGAAPIAMGSHLDTQPTGGKFDGTLGVLAGLEIMRALHEAGAQTEAPLVLVNWTNEEGARFSPPMMGSGAAMGLFTEAATLAKTDAEGAVFGAELRELAAEGRITLIEQHTDADGLLDLAEPVVGPAAPSVVEALVLLYSGELAMRLRPAARGTARPSTRAMAALVLDQVHLLDT